jgi:hypothetical protein
MLRLPGRIGQLGAVSLALAALGTQAQTEPPLGAAPDKYQPVLVTPAAAPRPVVVLDSRYAANARVAQIRVEVEGADAPADGVTPVLVTVRVYDSAGELLREPVLVTIEHTGHARLQLAGAATDETGPARRDADRQVPGTQLAIPAGEARFSLIAPSQPEEVQLRLTAGEASVEGRIDFAPDLRERVATGLVEGVLHVRGGSGQGAVVPARLEDGFESELTHWSRSFSDDRHQAGARAALFLKGKISGERLLTLSYDSDKDSRARLLSQVRPEAFYPVYGDASVKGVEAPSASRLYVRVDQGRSFVLWGDFSTADGVAQAAGSGLVAGSRLRQLGPYSRSLTGARLHVERADGFANVFASRDTLKLMVEEVLANGTSGPFAVGSAQALEQSERVELLVRDRNHRNTIVSATPLVRQVDYSFEPFSGRILLTRALPSVDADGNPLSLRISYEVDQGGEPFWLAGADGQINLGRDVTLGASLVEDRNPLARFRLSSANAGLRLGEHTALVVEAARTDANLSTIGLAGFTGPADPFGPTRAGQAGRMVLDHQDEQLHARFYANRADASFANGAAGVQPGTRQAGASASWHATDPLTLRAELQQTADLGSDARRQGASVAADYQLDAALTATVGLRHVEEIGRVSGSAASLGANPDAGSYFSASGGFTGAGSSTLLNVNNALTSTTGAAAGSVPDLAATTAFIGAGLKVTERVTLGGEVERRLGGDDGHRAELRSTYQWAERSRLYARVEQQSGLASRYALDPASRSTVGALGIDSSYMEGGQLFSEYRLRDADGSSAQQLASGLRNTWLVREGLALSSGLERLRVLSGSGQNATAASIGADLTTSPLWKASGRLEWRRLDAAQTLTTSTSAGSHTRTIDVQDSWLATLMLARKLDRDWTLLTRNYALVTDNHGALPNGWQDRFQIGAAYRPVQHNRLDVLTKYEYKVEDNISAADEWRRVHVGALQLNGHPSRPWWWSGRLAVKQVAERYPDLEGGAKDRYRAGLLSGRLIRDLTDRIDLGLLASVMRSGGSSGGARQRALGLELGYMLQNNLWLSAGCNWAGFVDRDLSTDQTARGAYIRLRFKFDADLFEGRNPAVNGSLPR